MGSVWKFFGFIFGIPLVISMIVWAFSTMANPSADNIAKAGNLIAQAAIPWWIPVIIWLAPLGLIGGPLIFLIVYLASKYGG
jgi:hypothetical protein